MDSPWLSIAAMACVSALLLRARRAREAALLGYLSGLATFVGGIGWLYVALHDYGGMAAPLAGAGVLLFCGFLALYPMLAAIAAAAAHRRVGPIAFVAATGAATAMTDLLRGWVFTGFPWLAPGYAQVDGALSGFAPLAGVYAVGGLAAASAAALAIVFTHWRARQTLCAALLFFVAVLQALGASAERVQWSEPHGGPIAIRLLQGNVEQSLKFDRDLLYGAMQRYVDMAVAQPAALTVLPETAWVIPVQNTPPELAAQLHDFVEHSGTAIAIGAPTVGVPTFASRPGHDSLALPAAMSNSVVVVDRNTIGTQSDELLAHPPYIYSKHHLVPFGEFVPYGFRWFVDRMDIPLGDMARGAANAPRLSIGGQRIAFDICYEDLFGEELLASLRGEDGATILANVTNIAWYGRSSALAQHLQISRMRALETARPIVRATNTGTTAHIAHDGRVLAKLPVVEVGALDVEVQGRSGLTPYARTGNLPVVLIALTILALVFLMARRRRPQRSTGSLAQPETSTPH